MWSDGTYTEELTNCNGRNAQIVTNTQCTIPLSVLMASPFNLKKGASISASVVAFNQVGDSGTSDVGNGAQVIVSTVPDAPINLARSATVTYDKTKIAIVWSDGAHDGY